VKRGQHVGPIFIASVSVSPAAGTTASTTKITTRGHMWFGEEEEGT